MTSTASSADPTPRDDGFVLIFVLGILLILALVTGSLQMKAQLDAKARRALSANAEMSAAADGMTRLLAYRLGEQRGGARLPDVIAVDGGTFSCGRGNTTFTMRVQDQAGLVDLNRSPIAVLEKLLAAVDARQPRRLAAAIIDFRDADDLVTEQGAEAVDYRSAGLAHAPKNAPFEAIEEIDQVIGMTPDYLRRLLPWITVSNDDAGLDAAVAPAALRRIFELADPGAIPTGTESRRGERGRSRIFGIDVVARRGEIVSGRRAIIEYGEQRPSGFTIRSWAQTGLDAQISAILPFQSACQ